MKNVGPLLGAFLLGVLCTVGVYEVVRFVTNTRDAIQAASALGADDEPSGAAVSTQPPSKTPKNRVDVDDALKDRLKREAARQAAGSGRKGKRTEAERAERRRRRQLRKQRRKERWQALSPEEQEAIRQKAAKRSNRVSAPGTGTRGKFAPGRFQGVRGGDRADDGPDDGFDDGFEDEEPFDDEAPRDTHAR